MYPERCAGGNGIGSVNCKIKLDESRNIEIFFEIASRGSRLCTINSLKSLWLTSTHGREERTSVFRDERTNVKAHVIEHNLLNSMIYYR